MSFLTAWLSAPPGLESSNVQEKGYEEEDSSGKTTTSANGCTSEDEIGGGSESTESPAPACSEKLLGNASEHEEVDLDRSCDKHSSDQEPEKDLDPDSGAGRGDLQGRRQRRQRQGRRRQAEKELDPDSRNSMPISIASSLQTTPGFAAHTGNVNSTMHLATAAFEAANGEMIDPLEWNNVCTVMMMNLSNQVAQQMLATEINSAGFSHAYGFMYPPIDPQTNANRGYSLQFDSVTDALPPPPGILTKETLPCVAKEGWKSSKKQDAEGLPKKRRAKASLIDIAARTNRTQNLLNETQEAPTKELAQPDSVIDALPPPPGILTKEILPCVKKGASKSSRQNDAEALPKKRSANFCPYCGGSVKADFKFCRFCGASVILESS